MPWCSECREYHPFTPPSHSLAYWEQLEHEREMRGRAKFLEMCKEAKEIFGLGVEEKGEVTVCNCRKCCWSVGD